jgi:hypothetical protein
MPYARGNWPLSAILLSLFGVCLIGIGVFFIVLRPPLLPEDVRYTGLTLTQLQAEQPRLAFWLLHVFRVLGGYAAAAGWLTLAIAATSFRRHELTAAVGVLVSGAASIGWMVIVNFVIDSDFKWLLLAIGLIWVFCLAAFWTERRTLHQAPAYAAAMKGVTGSTRAERQD